MSNQVELNYEGLDLVIVHDGKGVKLATFVDEGAKDIFMKLLIEVLLKRGGC